MPSARTTAAALILAAFCYFTVSLARAQIYVDHAAGGANDGTSWTSAFTDLQDALAAASAGDEIWVAAGTYVPTPGTDRGVSFDLVEGVALYGGFAGGETALSQRDVAFNETILSGEIGAVGFTDNSYHVVTADSTDSTTVLDGFTVTDGYAWESFSMPYDLNRGGGMYITDASPTVANVVFDGNRALRTGGGVYLERGSPTFTEVEFSNNIAGGQIGPSSTSGSGGGFYVWEGDPVFTGVVFEYNEVDKSDGQGGGLFNYRGTVTITDGAFRYNTYGAVDMYGPVAGATLIDVTFEQNTWGQNSYAGAEIPYAPSGVVTIDNARFINNNGTPLSVSDNATVTNSVFTGNTGYGFAAFRTSVVRDVIVTGNTDGGAYLSGSATLDRAWIVGNTAMTYGAGILVYGRAYTTVTNSVIHSNHLNSGPEADIYVAGFGNPVGAPQFTNCTIVAAEFGVGELLTATNSDVTLTNSILIGTAGNDPIAVGGGATVTSANCLISNSGGSGGGWNTNLGTDGGGNLDADPQFVDPGVDIFRVWHNSPAVNAGDNGAPGLTSEDFAGNPRIEDSIVDMGAFEFACPTGSPVFVDGSATGAGTGNSWTDAFVTMTEAMASACTSVQEIWVAAGTYLPTAGEDRAMTFSLRNGLTVYGGFGGGESALGERDVASNATILSGAIPGPNSQHVVTAEGVDATAILDGFTVEDGNADLGGGGLLVDGASPTIRNVTFEDNMALNNGGAVYTTGGSPTFLNVVFCNNAATNGGAMANFLNGDLSVVNAVFFANTVVSNGGAIYNVASSPSFTNVTLADNDANGFGGAIFHNLGSSVLVNTIAWGNSAPFGPEIYNQSGTQLISFSLIEGSGGSGGGWVPATGTDGGGNLDEDPLFVNVAAADVRLDAGSPAIDSGDNTAPDLPPTDLDGNPRIVGPTVDMGAYEYDAATGLPSIPSGGGSTVIRTAYPNPFNPNVTIVFDLAHAGFTEVAVYDVVGRLVKRLSTTTREAGPHVIRWDGTDERSNRVASGSYIVVVRSGGVSDHRSVILLK